MSDLKTLKDLKEVEVMGLHPADVNIFREEFSRDLKQEAVNWIKKKRQFGTWEGITHNIEKDTYYFHSSGREFVVDKKEAREFVLLRTLDEKTFMNFFNIMEEDLK